jgi:hypothetical protein
MCCLPVYGDATAGEEEEVVGIVERSMRRVHLA